MPSGFGLVSFFAVWKEGTTAASNTVDALLLKILRDFSTLPAWFNTNGRKRRVSQNRRVFSAR